VKRLVQGLGGQDVRELHLGNNKIKAGGARSIAKFVRQANNLKTLDLRGNCIRNEGMHELAAAVSESTSITFLDVRRNEISSAGAKDLAKLLEDNLSLTELDLRHNPLGHEGAMALKVALERSGRAPDIRIDAVFSKYLEKVLQTNRTKALVLTLQCTRLEQGGIVRAECTNMAGETVATHYVQSSTTLVHVRAQVGKDVEFPAECIKLVTRDGALLDNMYATVGEVAGDSS